MPEAIGLVYCTVHQVSYLKIQRTRNTLFISGFRCIMGERERANQVAFYVVLVCMRRYYALRDIM